MYRLSAFYLSRMASDLPMEFAYPALFVGIVYFMGALRLSAAAFFGNLLSMLLLVLVAEVRVVCVLCVVRVGCWLVFCAF